jgi:hypothetical protein
MGSSGGGKSPGLPSLGDMVNTFLGVNGGSLGDAINRGNPKLEQNLNNVGGEISGANSQRQADWQKQVATNAEAARLKDIADKQLAVQNTDVKASSAAGSAQKTSWVSRGTSGFNLNWANPSGKDTTDFLGL